MLAAATLALGACGGGYDRQGWHDTLTDSYGIAGADATCILDAVERDGLTDRFAGDSVTVDFDIERIIRECDVPITDRWRLGVTGF